MRARNVLFLLLFLAGGCAERSVDVDPLVDLCADAPARIAIDDDACDAADVNAGDCIVGDAEIALDEFSNVDVVSVTGSLLVHANGFEVTLQRLRSVGGCVAVSGGDGDALSARFPSLIEASRVVLGERTLTSVDLSSLRRGDVVVEECELLDLSLEAHRDGNLEVRRAPNLRSLRANTLSGGVIVDGAGLLGALELPELVDAADVSIGSTGLATLSLPLLEQVGRLSVVDNPALRALAVPALRRVESALRIAGNALDDDDVCAVVAAVDAGAVVTVDAACPGR